MIKRIVCLTIMCFAFGAVVSAQTPARKEDKFKALVTKLKSGDTKIDFKELRMSSIDSSEKDAGAKAEQEDYRKAIAAIRGSKMSEAIKAAEKSLAGGYLDSDVHGLLALAYREKGNAARFEFHKAVHLGLMDSILTGADGKSAATAYVVIDVGEEYAVLRALELQRGSQGMRIVDGHKYDVLTVTDPKTKQTREVWFNIDIVWKRYEKVLK
jgi:hypothetical protein